MCIKFTKQESVRDSNYILHEIFFPHQICFSISHMQIINELLSIAVFVHNMHERTTPVKAMKQTTDMANRSQKRFIPPLHQLYQQTQSTYFVPFVHIAPTC